MQAVVAVVFQTELLVKTPLKILKTVMATNTLLKMFKTLDKGAVITFSRGLYAEFTRYCEVLGTNIFPICQYSPNIRQYSSLFAIFCHLSPLFVTIHHCS